MLTRNAVAAAIAAVASVVVVVGSVNADHAGAGKVRRAPSTIAMRHHLDGAATGPSQAETAREPRRRDGDYYIGDLVDGRSLEWSQPDSAAIRTDAVLVPVARAGRIIGFVKSEELLAPPPAPTSSSVDSFPAMSIVNEAGQVIGEFVDGQPVLKGDG